MSDRLALRADLACVQPDVDPELFFPVSPAEWKAAEAICTTCPARHACLTYAVEQATTDGVWGGVLFDRGPILEHGRRRIGRPHLT